MTTGTRKAGDFCWINMLTPEPAKAREFFSMLFGWTYVEIPGMGHRMQVGGRDIGGLWDLNAPQTPPGTPPLIGVMVKVDSADAASSRAAQLGGKAKPAFDVMDQGRMAELFDPNGAQLDVWQPKKGQGSDADSNAHGAPSWFETITTDTGAAGKFYTALFGWTAEAMDMGGGFTYTTFKLGTVPVAGMMGISPDMAAMGVRPHWGVYFTVKNVDQAASEAAKLGATVFIPPRDIPGVGRFTGLVSPQGVRFYAISYLSAR